MEKTCLHKSWIIPKSAFVTRIMEGNKCVTYKSIYTEKNHKQKHLQKSLSCKLFFLLSGFLDMILNFSQTRMLLLLLNTVTMAFPRLILISKADSASLSPLTVIWKHGTVYMKRGWPASVANLLFKLITFIWHLLQELILLPLLLLPKNCHKFTARILSKINKMKMLRWRYSSFACLNA